jgi:tetratricopeptide (TPR) repeat protein
MRLGRHDEAIASLTRAVDSAAGGTVMLCELGWALGVAGRRDEAAAMLGRSPSAAARVYVSPYARAKILLALGRREEALDGLDEAAEDPRRLDHLRGRGPVARFTPRHAADSMRSSGGCWPAISPWRASRRAFISSGFFRAACSGRWRTSACRLPPGSTLVGFRHLQAVLAGLAEHQAWPFQRASTSSRCPSSVLRANFRPK